MPANWSPREPDDDPPPRRFRPAGVLDQLPDGAHRLPDLRGRLAARRPPMPAGLKTAGERRRWARNVAILAGRQAGWPLKALAEDFRLSVPQVCRILRDMRQRLTVA